MRKILLHTLLVLQILMVEFIGGLSELKYNNTNLGNNYQIKDYNIIIMFLFLFLNITIIIIEKKFLNKYITVKVLNNYIYIYTLFKITVIILAIIMINPSQTILGIEDLH